MFDVVGSCIMASSLSTNIETFHSNIDGLLGLNLKTNQPNQTQNQNQIHGGSTFQREAVANKEAETSNYEFGKAAGTGIGKKQIKKPKIAFQTRSWVDILDDGYRWRKYGQKAVKNNKFLRSYYKCTSQGCNVKKQVQRLSKDEGVVVTTYEGVHTHSIDKPTDNFDQILSQMKIYPSFLNNISSNQYK